MFGRRRGALVAAWAGAATYFAVRVAAQADAPFAVYQAPDALARRFVRADGLFDVVDLAAGALVVWPLLVQMLVWAGLALGIACAVRQTSVERRLWVWAGSLAAACDRPVVALPRRRGGWRSCCSPRWCRSCRSRRGYGA